jgi:hypothetical protein
MTDTFCDNYGYRKHLTVNQLRCFIALVQPEAFRKTLASLETRVLFVWTIIWLQTVADVIHAYYFAVSRFPLRHRDVFEPSLVGSSPVNRSDDVSANIDYVARRSRSGRHIILSRPGKQGSSRSRLMNSNRNCVCLSYGVTDRAARRRHDWARRRHDWARRRHDWARRRHDWAHTAPSS